MLVGVTLFLARVRGLLFLLVLWAADSSVPSMSTPNSLSSGYCSMISSSEQPFARLGRTHICPNAASKTGNKIPTHLHARLRIHPKEQAMDKQQRINPSIDQDKEHLVLDSRDQPFLSSAHRPHTTRSLYPWPDH